ncbi:MAG: hypothetical protein J5534_07480 [Fibrobacter sp.]|nr:hypothetical protein [Fibrobacter sp.]
MKQYILGILLTVASAIAQEGLEPAIPDEQAEQAVPAEQAETNDLAANPAEQAESNVLAADPAEQVEPTEQAAPERTPEGYRIIRIEVEQTKIYKDSVEKVKKIEAEKPHDPVPFKFSVGFAASIGIKDLLGKYDRSIYATDTTNGVVFGYNFEIGATALIPLSEYNFAIKTGVLFNYTSLTSARIDLLDPLQIKYNVMNNEIKTDFDGEISQGRLTIPLLIALKTMRSPAMFEIGPQFSIPLFDKYDDGSYKVDLIDNGTRASLDLAMVIGGDLYVSPTFLINVYLAIATNDPYKTDDFFVGVSNMSLFELKIGLTKFFF